MELSQHVLYRHLFLGAWAKVINPGCPVSVLKTMRLMRVFAFCGCVATQASPLWAQDNEAESTGDEASLDSSHWALSLGAVATYTDNFFNQPQVKQDAMGGVVSPLIDYRSGTRKIDLDGSISGEYGTFDIPGSVDDYLDAAAGAKIGIKTDLRNRFVLNAGFNHDHDPFGADRTENATFRTTDLDRWNQVQGGLRYLFGTPGARVSAEIGLSKRRKHYITNRSSTQVLDSESDTADYAVFYHFTPKTSALVDFSRTDSEFEFPFTTPGAELRDGTLYRLRVGTRWLATAKTSGDIRVGVRRRTFDSGRPDVEGLDWQAAMQWSPRAASLIEFRAGRSEQDSYSANTRTIDTGFGAIEWKQNWTSRTKSSLNLEYIQLKFVGSTRTDDLIRAGVGINYLALSYLSVVTRFSYEDRSSNLGGRDYERFNSFLGLRLSR